MNRSQCPQYWHWPSFCPSGFEYGPEEFAAGVGKGLYPIFSTVDLKTPNSIGRETGAQVLVMPPSVGGVKEVTDYFKLFDYDINLVVEAIKKSGAK